ncbi:MAG: hypothetical protein M1830_008595 [Pleopsidium flavum]|nr:MAG: hypothetical protein M1830_008595 [Pleopsidium flavum]
MPTASSSHNTEQTDMAVVDYFTLPHHEHKDIVIFWGSQSGTAEGFANRLAEEIHLRFGVEALAADLSDYDPETIDLIPEAKAAIFMIATYGEGDPSDNTAGLWDWVTRFPDLSLQNFRYVAFGLGNRNYKHYNRVIDIVADAFDRARATKLLPVCRADDSAGARQEDFMEWKESLFTLFRDDFGYEERELVYEPMIAVVEDDSMTSIDLHCGEPVPQRETSRAATSNSEVRPLPVVAAKELIKSSTRKCLHMEVDLSLYPEIKYKTGDHLDVWPSNPDTEIVRLLRVLGLEESKDVPISINMVDLSASLNVPTPTSRHALFRHYLEICSPVSRDTILSLIQFAPTPSAKLFLTTLGRNKHAYAELLHGTHLNIGRLLEMAVQGSGSWDDLPLSLLIETLPALTLATTPFPRHPSSKHVKQRSRLLTPPQNPEETLLGVATHYLLALERSLNVKSGAQFHPYDPTYNLDGPNEALKGGRIFAHIKRSKLKLPVLSPSPIVLVAAGTGIAPFRGFLQERARLKTMGREVGQIILFFGCRCADEDFLYSDELEGMVQTFAGALKIVMAF